MIFSKWVKYRFDPVRRPDDFEKTSDGYSGLSFILKPRLRILRIPIPTKKVTNKQIE